MLKVGIIRFSSKESVKELLELINWQEFITKDQDIYLKPNLGWDNYLPGACTSSKIIEGVILTIYDYVKNIYIIEQEQILVDANKAAKKYGIFELCKKYEKVKWLNLSKAKLKYKKFFLQSINQEIELPEILLNSQLITVPVMKTHSKTTVSCSLKNQFGLLPKQRYNLHPYLTEVLYEINNIIRPRLSIVDATICLEGNGPKSGIPKRCDLILASTDLVALDTVCAKIMDFEPDNIAHIRYAAEMKLGENNLNKIEIIGYDIRNLNLNFKKPKSNLVAKYEEKLRLSLLNNLIFNTKLLHLFCISAKIYYFLWYNLIGRRYKNMEYCNE